MADEADYARWTAAIGAEWELDTGFFWKCREGEFSPADFTRTHELLRSISVAEDASLPRSFVAVLWFIPQFMEWQIERVQRNGGDVVAYRNAGNRMWDEIQRILGMP